METAPGSRGKKPVTKAQIRKLQAAYAQGDEIAKENREREEREMMEAQGEIDDLLTGV